MRYNTSKLVLILLLLPLMAFEKVNLLNKRMPILPGRTLDGQTIDASYYKGHVTLVNFMYIGCPPCMNEVGILNKIKAEYANEPRFQLLSIPRQMRDQMIEFNRGEKGVLFQIRKALGIDSIQYAVLPGCPDGPSKMVTEGDNVQVKSECSTLEEMYGVTSFPTNFLVDENGIIRSIDVGGPPTKNEVDFHDRLKKKIDEMLAKK